MILYSLRLAPQCVHIHYNYIQEIAKIALLVSEKHHLGSFTYALLEEGMEGISSWIASDGIKR